MSTPTPATPAIPPASTASRSSRPIHPLALRQQGLGDNFSGSIDILYGGTESEVLRESIDLGRDLMAQGQDEDHVLYINTLISARAFEPHVRRAGKNIPQNRRFHSITLLQQSLAQKLAFLKRTIEELNIRHLILNGFEFGALTSRHKIEIFFWLKSLRDELSISIIIFTQSGPRKYGTLGQMRFVSKSCEEVGAYIREHEAEESAIARAKQKAFDDAEAARPKKESELFEARMKKHPDGTPMYLADGVKLQWLKDKEAATTEASATEASATEASASEERESKENETLKTKELEVENVAS